MAILIPETGMVYPTISAAAQAVGVDPSNAGKVLRGKRSSAGGYSFRSVSATPTQKEITKTAREIQQKLTPKQQQRREQSRQRSRQRVQERIQKNRPARRTAAEREKIKQAHKILVEANELIRQAKKGGTGQVMKTDLLSLAQQVGASKQGLFKTAETDISKYQNLDQLLQRIQQIKAQETERRKMYDANYAQQYGLGSMAEAAAKHDALDALARAYEKLREVKDRSSGKFSYRDIYTDMVRDVQDLDPEEIMDLADRLDEWLESDREKDQDALDQIYQEWQSEIEGGGDFDGEYDDEDPDYINW